MFLRLFQIVSRNNIIKISLSFNTPSCIEPLRKLLVTMDAADEQNVAKALRGKLEALLDTYDLTIQEDTDDMRQLKNYLAKANENMRKELISFIKRKAKIGRAELNKLNKFFK